MSNDRVNPVFLPALEAIFGSPSKVAAQLREYERLVDCAEAHQAVPDFADVNTLKEILPAEVVTAVADLMAVFQMGAQAHRDELLKSCAKLEMALFVRYSR